MMLKLFIQSVSLSTFLIPCLVSGNIQLLTVLNEGGQHLTARSKLLDPGDHLDVKKKPKTHHMEGLFCNILIDLKNYKFTVENIII